MYTYEDDATNIWVFSTSNNPVVVRWYWGEIEDFRISKNNAQTISIFYRIKETYIKAIERYKTLKLVIWMLAGNQCKYPNQSYTVSYKNGAFVATNSGALIGNINKLKIIRNKNVNN